MLMILVTMVLGDWRWYGVPIDSDHQLAGEDKRRGESIVCVRTGGKAKVEQEGEQGNEVMELKGG
jgi:hypothetical protein